MEQWIEIASKNGIAVLVLVALGLFLYKKMWPAIEKRLDAADIERKENLQRWEEQGKLFTEALRQEREDNARRFEDQGKVFMAALRTQSVMVDQTHKESMKTQTKIAEKLDSLDQQVRNNNGK